MELICEEEDNVSDEIPNENESVELVANETADIKPGISAREFISSEQSRSKKRKNCDGKCESEEPLIKEAYTIFKQAYKRESCDIYGEHIAFKLKSYNERTRNIVQHLFNDILFEADMGKYNCKPPAPDSNSNNSACSCSH